MGIPFLKKSRFTGSDGMLRFLLERRNVETLPEGALWCPKDTAAQCEISSTEAASQDQGGEKVCGGMKAGA